MKKRDSNSYPQLSSKSASLFIPDGQSSERALSRTTHLGVGAHQDDLEIMAFHGIAQCFGSKKKWFSGITCTDGASSPRSGGKKRISNDQMKIIRSEEQKKAARIGKYAAMVQLSYSSSDIKERINPFLVQDLFCLLQRTKPQFLYTHNPIDKHPTHIAIVLHLIEALKRLPKNQRPKNFYGCEVWRSLDWVPDKIKVGLDVSGHSALAKKLLTVFQSQIKGGKQYDKATLGRRKANATYFETRKVDQTEEMIYALDLEPLLRKGMKPERFARSIIDRFKKDALGALQT